MMCFSNCRQRERTVGEIKRSLESLSARLNEFKALSYNIVTPQRLRDLPSPDTVIDVTRALNLGISKAEYELAEAYRVAKLVTDLAHSTCAPSEWEEVTAIFEESAQAVAHSLDQLILPRYRLEHIINLVASRVLEIELRLYLPERLVAHALTEGYTVEEIAKAIGQPEKWVHSKWMSALEIWTSEKKRLDSL